MNGVNKPGEISPVLKLAVLVMGLFALGIIPLVIFLGPRQPDSGAGDTRYVQIPQQHHEDQEIVVSANKTTLYVPKDAIEYGLTGNFVISPREPDLYAYAGQSGWSRPIVVDIQYMNDEGVTYHGFTFSKPASVCFALTADQWTDFTGRPDDYQVQYFDKAESPFRWISMPITTDPQRSELCTQTDHLSTYALAIKSVEGIPITGATQTPTTTPTTLPSRMPGTILSPEPTRRTRDSDNPTAVAPPPPQPTEPPPPTDPPPPPPTDEPPPPPPPPTEEPPIIELPTIDPL